MTGPRIVVVGAGFSGLLTAVHLLRSRPDVRVDLVEKAATAGEGAAYATHNPDHVLNVRIDNMSAFHQDPGHLTTWLSTQPNWTAQDAFITREDYGRYLKDILAEAQAESPVGSQPRLRVIHDEAIEAHPVPGGWRVGLNSGGSIEAQVVVLALGNLEPARPAGLDDAVVRAGRFIADPWRAAAEVPRDADRILLIGSGLTMIDVALSLARPRRRLFAVSRRGLAPRAHKAAGPMITPQTYSGSPPTVLRQVRSMAAVADWRAVTDDLRKSARTLWRGWSSCQRRQFLRHLRSVWDVHRHRLAPSVANRMQSLIASGELSIDAGRIVRIERNGAGIKVIWKPRGAARMRERKVDAVVNCTGPLTDITRSTVTLIARLVGSGQAQGDPDNLGFHVDDACRLIAANGEVQHRLFAVGPLTRGAFWEITSVPDIRLQAMEVAAAIDAELRQVSAGEG